jgi:hypothetical protein
MLDEQTGPPWQREHAAFRNEEADPARAIARRAVLAEAIAARRRAERQRGLNEWLVDPATTTNPS